MMPEYSVSANRLGDTGSKASSNGARVILERGMVGGPDAFNPAELLHKNIRKYGTVPNTLAAALALSGTIRRIS